jgi:hypothetical protein
MSAEQPPPASQPAPINCLPGTIGMWSMPDIVGKEVYICRDLRAGAPPNQPARMY